MKRNEMYMQENIQCYLNEKEKREKRLEIYAGIEGVRYRKFFIKKA